MLHGIVDGSGAGSDMGHLDLSISTSSTSSNNLQRPKKIGLGGAQLDVAKLVRPGGLAWSA